MNVAKWLFWDFQLLDSNMDGRISLEDSHLLLQQTLGDDIVEQIWNQFLMSLLNTDFGVCWEDLERWIFGRSELFMKNKVTSHLSDQLEPQNRLHSTNELSPMATDEYMSNNGCQQVTKSTEEENQCPRDLSKLEGPSGDNAGNNLDAKNEIPLWHVANEQILEEATYQANWKMSDNPGADEEVLESHEHEQSLVTVTWIPQVLQEGATGDGEENIKTKEHAVYSDDLEKDEDIQLVEVITVPKIPETKVKKDAFSLNSDPLCLKLEDKEQKPGIINSDDAENDAVSKEMNIADKHDLHKNQESQDAGNISSRRLPEARTTSSQKEPESQTVHSAINNNKLQPLEEKGRDNASNGEDGNQNDVVSEKLDATDKNNLQGNQEIQDDVITCNTREPDPQTAHSAINNANLQSLEEKGQDSLINTENGSLIVSASAVNAFVYFNNTKCEHKHHPFQTASSISKYIVWGMLNI
ncbi:uncharacterized protein LOC122815064 [Protopterus annectens]|uniref:uncharacterized protein LOC122815064 n=1 Tax=Protopterus annectens TaxID=7888 RepID=UPI001CFBD038|nr:uncharacterized protein LOC122815064 [Protopterus annectens]